MKVYVPANTAKVAPKQTENESVWSVAPAPEPEALVPSSNDTLESSTGQDEGM